MFGTPGDAALSPEWLPRALFYVVNFPTFMSDDLPHPGARPAVLAALRQLLRPLVRFLLDQQVSFPMLSRLLKEIYVDVADQELPLAGRTQTITRLSLLTGVHRKDVKRLRDATAPEAAFAAAAPLGALIAVRWTGDEAYLDADGRPLALPRHTAGDQPSFEGLVASVSTDIRPRTVLDEWLRLGVARLDAEDRVHLQVEAFVPETGFDEKAYFFGRNTRDHLAAAGHNLRGELPALPDRAVYYGGISEASAEELRVLAEEAGMEALQRVNRRARSLKKRDPSASSAGQRMTMGFYFYRGPDDDDEFRPDEPTAGSPDDEA